MVSFAGAIALGFQRYFDFSGRSSRSEYWWWFLFNLLVGWIPFVGLVLLIPNIAIGVRRLHDINRTGWWILFAYLFFWLFFIPLLLLLYWATRSSDSVDNKYGPGALGPGDQSDSKFDEPDEQDDSERGYSRHRQHLWGNLSNFWIVVWLLMGLSAVIVIGYIVVTEASKGPLIEVELSGADEGSNSNSQSRTGGTTSQSAAPVSAPVYEGCDGLEDLIPKLKSIGGSSLGYYQIVQFGDNAVCDDTIEKLNKPELLKDGVSSPNSQSRTGGTTSQSAAPVSAPVYEGCDGLEDLIPKLKSIGGSSLGYYQIVQFGDNAVCDDTIEKLNKPELLKD